MDETRGLPLICSIVPVYNVKDYVEKCLDSICGQTYKNLEIVVVDDGSTDGSGEICDTYAQKDPRVKDIHRENRGVSAVRNEGLDIALGEYICFVDGDEWIDSDMYEFLYQFLIVNEADISVCSHYIEKPGKRKIKYASDKVLNLIPRDAIRLLAKDDIVRNYLWDKLFKRELFDGLRFPQNTCFEDMAVMYRIFYRARKVVLKSQPKYHYMIRTDSLIGSKYDPNKEYQMFLAVNEQNRFILEKGIWDKTPIFVILCGIHLIDHIMLVHPSPATEEIIRNVLDTIHQYDETTWKQIGMACAIKRWAIYKNLLAYRSVYRFVRSILKSKNHRF